MQENAKSRFGRAKPTDLCGGAVRRFTNIFSYIRDFNFSRIIYLDMSRTEAR
jgi:hypothetical protein